MKISSKNRLPNDKLIYFNDRLYYGNNLQPILTSGLSANYLIKTYEINSGSAPFEITIPLELPNVIDNIVYLNIGYGFVGRINLQSSINDAYLTQQLYVYNTIIQNSKTRYKASMNINNTYLNNANIAYLRAPDNRWHLVNTIDNTSLNDAQKIEDKNYYYIYTEDTITSYYGVLTVALFYIA